MKCKRAILLSIVVTLLAQSVEWVRQTEIAFLVANIQSDAMRGLGYESPCVSPSEYDYHVANFLKILSATVSSDPTTALRSQNKTQRFLGMVSLAQLNLDRKADTIPLLQLALRDSDSNIRVLAFESLSKMKAITIPEIREGLHGRSTLRAATNAARRLGRKAQPVAAELLRISVEDFVCPNISTEYVLQNIGVEPAIAVDIFRDALKNPRMATRQTAIRYLAEMETIALPALPELKAIMADQIYSRLHDNAADAIRRIKYGGISGLGGG
jgi:HEAT repeat protein